MGGLSGWIFSQKPFGDREFGGGIACGEQPVVSDFDEVFGQDVKQKAANEFLRLHGDGAAVLGEKPHPTFVETQQSLVGDSDPVRVATKVLENLIGRSEGRFGIDHPFLSVESVFEFNKYR